MDRKKLGNRGVQFGLQGGWDDIAEKTKQNLTPGLIWWGEGP